MASSFNQPMRCACAYDAMHAGGTKGRIVPGMAEEIKGEGPRGTASSRRPLRPVPVTRLEDVVVRLLTNDHPAQAARAAAVFRSAPVFVAKSVLLETKWVLRYS